MAGSNSNIPVGMFTSEAEKKRLLNAVSASKVQNESDRRIIRQNYRKLMDDLSGENKQVLIDPADEQNLLQQTLKTVDKLFAKVNEAREGTLDSMSLVQIAELGMKKAQALQTDFVRFYPFDFCEKVKVVIAGELDSSDRNPFSHDNWIRLGSVVQHLFQKTPTLRFMCGSFDRGQVSLKKMVKASKEEKIVDKSSGKVTQPAQISRFEKVEGGELTTVFVEHVLKTLWKIYEQSESEPVDFFEFVTHPTSFGQTVENIFYTSFLIRDGHAKISLDSEQLPVIEPVQKKETGSDDESSERKQLVLTITQAQWKEIVTTFKIEEPVIKTMTMDMDMEEAGSQDS